MAHFDRPSTLRPLELGVAARGVHDSNSKRNNNISHPLVCVCMCVMRMSNVIRENNAVTRTTRTTGGATGHSQHSPMSPIALSFHFTQAPACQHFGFALSLPSLNCTDASSLTHCAQNFCWAKLKGLDSPAIVRRMAVSLRGTQAHTHTTHRRTRTGAATSSPRPRAGQARDSSSGFGFGLRSARLGSSLPFHKWQSTSTRFRCSVYQRIQRNLVVASDFVSN